MDLNQCVHNLIYSYAEFVDDGDFDALAALFTQGSISFSPGQLSLHGKREVADFYRRVVRIDPNTGTPRTTHRVTNVIVVPGLHEWQARSRYDVMQHAEDGVPTLIATGRYFDRFRVEGETLHFHHRKVVSEFLGSADQHLMLDQQSVDNRFNERVLAR